MRTLNGARARVAQRRDDERAHGGVVLLAVGGGERLDAGLAELARVRLVGAARLIAERRAAVAIARRRVAARVPLQMQAGRSAR